MTDERFKIQILYGIKELQTRLYPMPDGSIVGQGRSRTVDRDGLPGEWSAWESSGAVLRFDAEPKPAPWWRMFKRKAEV
jgi:hypothetical protein